MGLLTSGEPLTGTTRLSDWLAENGDGLGRRYVSELRRTTGGSGHRDGSAKRLAARAWAALPPPMRSCHNRGVVGRALGEPHSPPSHISKIVPPTIHLGPPEEARTPRKDRCAKDHRAPNHISKMVLSTVHLGWAKRTVVRMLDQNGFRSKYF